MNKRMNFDLELMVRQILKQEKIIFLKSREAGKNKNLILKLLAWTHYEWDF